MGVLVMVTTNMASPCPDRAGRRCECRQNRASPSCLWALNIQRRARLFPSSAHAPGPVARVGRERRVSSGHSDAARSRESPGMRLSGSTPKPAHLRPSCERHEEPRRMDFSGLATNGSEPVRTHFHVPLRSPGLQDPYFLEPRAISAADDRRIQRRLSRNRISSHQCLHCCLHVSERQRSRGVLRVSHRFPSSEQIASFIMVMHVTV